MDRPGAMPPGIFAFEGVAPEQMGRLIYTRSRLTVGVRILDAMPLARYTRFGFQDFQGGGWGRTGALPADEEFRELPVQKEGGKA